MLRKMKSPRPKAKKLSSPRRVDGSSAGHVYLIEAGGRYKIGRARDLASRLKSLNCAAPFPMELVAARFTSCAPAEERWWHRLFKDSRIHGEWFDLSIEDIIEFCKGASVIDPKQAIKLLGRVGED